MRCALGVDNGGTKIAAAYVQENGFMCEFGEADKPALG